MERYKIKVTLIKRQQPLAASTSCFARVALVTGSLLQILCCSCTGAKPELLGDNTPPLLPLHLLADRTERTVIPEVQVSLAPEV
jgi:hypothetical protein